ncbi:hypothetical protein M2444_004806 [Paenibacillus sp. PastF-3]|uniref:hypothetical protein n=1 Tax=Paenibacillus sp. PastF-3 TaxID=2940626 RepID=UPI0024746687|nr:hypothetical protein [Paenibacillus sp. PastF-3]MDH6372976.1 hypothetical protein [Paenibacillus sp. PastF-3]
MHIFSRLKSKKVDVIKDDHLLIGSTQSGRTHNWLNEREKLKMIANSLLVKGEVHYVDLSVNDNNKFTNLLPGCQTYQYANEFTILLTDFKRKFDQRIKLFSEGRSIADLPFIYMVVNETDELPEDLRISLQLCMKYLLEKQRIAKMVFVLYSSKEDSWDQYYKMNKFVPINYSPNLLKS